MLNSENALLAVVDVQGKLAEVVAESSERLAKVITLARGCKMLGMPVLLTAQAPQKIGSTTPALRSILQNEPEMPRFSFNILADSGFRKALEETEKKQVILCGYESHICIYQSALALAEEGWQVFLVEDAVSSRSLNDKRVALAELARNPAIHLFTLEMLLFALLKDARHPAFKDLSRLIR